MDVFLTIVLIVLVFWLMFRLTKRPLKEYEESEEGKIHNEEVDLHRELGRRQNSDMDNWSKYPSLEIRHLQLLQRKIALKKMKEQKK